MQRSSPATTIIGSASPHPASAASTDAGYPGIDSRCQRVMVVDDNEDTAAALAAMLTTAGHQVSIAHDALQALSLIARMKPTVVLLDIGLPVMDGFELATRIRREFG